MFPTGVRFGIYSEIRNKVKWKDRSVDKLRLHRKIDYEKKR